MSSPDLNSNLPQSPHCEKLPRGLDLMASTQLLRKTTRSSLTKGVLFYKMDRMMSFGPQVEYFMPYDTVDNINMKWSYILTLHFRFHLTEL